ncbi:hypothetical protein RFI_39635, partial [Reticulomyxa filosa]
SSSSTNYSSPGRIDGKVIFAPRSSGDREERLRLYQRMKSDVTSDCKKHLHFGQKKKKKKSNMKEDENNELEKDREQHSMASDFSRRLSLSPSLSQSQSQSQSPSFCSSHHHDKDKADRQTPKHDRFSSACKKKQNKNKKWDQCAAADHSLVRPKTLPPPPATPLTDQLFRSITQSRGGAGAMDNTRKKHTHVPPATPLTDQIFGSWSKKSVSKTSALGLLVPASAPRLRDAMFRPQLQTCQEHNALDSNACNAKEGFLSDILAKK